MVLIQQEDSPAAKMVELKSAGYVLAIIAFMVSLGVNINTYTNDEGVIIDEGYLPYSCEKETVEDMYYELKLLARDLIQPCKVCKEPVECPKLSGGGGGSSCPACPSCNADGTTECTEIIGFAITEQGRYYCRDCGPDGCDACISNEDIDLSLELHEFD